MLSTLYITHLQMFTNKKKFLINYICFKIYRNWLKDKTEEKMREKKRKDKRREETKEKEERKNIFMFGKIQ